MMLEILSLILSITYLTWVFLLDHYGPLPSSTNQVYQQNFNPRPVNILDYFRRIFGVYEVTYIKDAEGARYVWLVKPIVFLWYCPFCLSFWIQIPFLSIYIAFGLITAAAAMQLIFAIPLLVGIIVKTLDALIITLEKVETL